MVTITLKRKALLFIFCASSILFEANKSQSSFLFRYYATSQTPFLRAKWEVMFPMLIELL